MTWAWLRRGILKRETDMKKKRETKNEEKQTIIWTLLKTY